MNTTNPTNLSTWHADAQNDGRPLTSLQPVSGGMYGGPSITMVDGTPTPFNCDDGLYHLWYHAAETAGVLPTDVWHATSPNLLEWNITGMVLEHLGTDTWESDQTADPSPVLVGKDRAMLFYDGDNNYAPSCGIGGSVWNRTEA